MKILPSIFNDVIGPIMRGPSSSHTAASWRAGKMAIQILNDELTQALIEFDKDGAWVTNYKDQGTVLGMDGGLLEIDMADDRMKRTDEIAEQRGIIIDYKISTFPNTHANSMQITLTGKKGGKVKILAASLGGGSFELQEVDGFPVNMKGDYHELFMWSNQDISKEINDILPDHTTLSINEKSGKYLYIYESFKSFDHVLIQHIDSLSEVEKVANVKPIMPITAGRQSNPPFSTIESLVEYSKNSNLSLGELGLMYEQHRSGLSEQELKDKMQNIIELIEGSIAIGLRGTSHEDRILPQQSHLIEKAEKSKKILQNSIINSIVKNVAAIMEAKSALEVIVANPTAGSCGTVGAAMKAVADDIGATMEDKIMAYYAAGLVGAYFAMGPGFSAEEHGCQVECGASAGMAAAGIVDFFGGTAEQALGAGSMAIQNMIGLVCDPIADRVEAPCLGKNTSAAVNALSSATMAVAGFAHLIPLDQVLETVVRVSADMPTCVKCTGLGGLAITPAAIALKEKLNQAK
ncbi:L-serine ammonia-lyase, iron-sulfur-dependent, subunit alpha [Portibacter lacus]|uniref:L-serine ammonia-lyase n=1 Tax=Portibacter lacus TaxID=1099794 RepID=A0AA37SKY7_9BACT|nr:L-serine ammonia-lyase, iron-sulfur-dependent, subunit alpha [Portibacter lacus]GLR15424.1 serine dehydratase [Portibacter lacus]